VLLSELWRWSGDDAIVRELEGNARRALAWIEDNLRPRAIGFATAAPLRLHLPP